MHLERRAALVTPDQLRDEPDVVDDGDPDVDDVHAALTVELDPYRYAHPDSPWSDS